MSQQHIELDYQPDCLTFASPDPRSLSDSKLQERIAYCERRIRQLTRATQGWTVLLKKTIQRFETTSDDVLPLARTERSATERIAAYTQEITLLKQVLKQRQEYDHV